MGREATEKTLGVDTPSGEGGYVNQSTRPVSEETILEPSSPLSQALSEVQPLLLSDIIN